MSNFKTNYFLDLPEELQEKIYFELHYNNMTIVYMHDLTNIINRRTDCMQNMDNVAHIYLFFITGQELVYSLGDEETIYRYEKEYKKLMPACKRILDKWLQIYDIEAKRHNISNLADHLKFATQTALQKMCTENNMYYSKRWQRTRLIKMLMAI